jgi:hypothetical protein
MKIIAPNNFFSRLFFYFSPSNIKDNIQYLPSSLITTELKKTDNSVALIPSMDLIQNKDIYVSKLFGMSFEGNLCNSYIYYNAKGKDIPEITLSGDVSSCEAVLTKILYKELYDQEVKIKLAVSPGDKPDASFILTGDNNFVNDIFVNGISYAEEMVELINLPYVNYLFASNDPDLIRQFNSMAESFITEFTEKPEEAVKALLPPNIQEYALANLYSLIFKFDETDLEGVEQLLRLPYFHGIINEIVELNLV